MPTLLNDSEIEKLLDTVISNGDKTSIRSNSYVLRLGAEGEFLNSSKQFKLDDKQKKGIIVPPGHSVGVSAMETLDFSRETVHAIFPGCDIHGFLSPSTDLAREGVAAPSTQVDAGFYGTINWTLLNNSSEERRFLLGERLFRLTLFKLESDSEIPEKTYSGDYQEKTGYIRSSRPGAPAGMPKSAWVTAYQEGGPEDLLDELMNSGFPWNILGSRLKTVDDQFATVTNEYSAILDSIDRISKDVEHSIDKISKDVEKSAITDSDIKNLMRSVLKEELPHFETKQYLNLGIIATGFSSIALGLFSTEVTRNIFANYGGIISILLLILCIVMYIAINKKGN